MLEALLLFLKIAVSLTLIALISYNDKKEVMNQYCYSECVEGKHYRKKINMSNIF